MKIADTYIYKIRCAPSKDTPKLFKRTGYAISRVLFGPQKKEAAPAIYPDATLPLRSIVLPSNVFITPFGLNKLGRVALYDVGIHELSASEVHGSYVTARPVSSYLTFSPLPH